VRASDRDRRRAERRLRASYVRGELSTDTFEGRLSAAMTARHAGELRALSFDLPSLAHRLRALLRDLAGPQGDAGPVLVAPAAVTGTALTLGRSLDADVRFVERSVSRRHAELRRTADGWLLIDRGSTNGTWVNGGRVVRALLDDGDVIQLGDARVVFRG
jgi:2-phospho-L-lactate guanylyltransferase (CobY/MobA/RfbA family)